MVTMEEKRAIYMSSYENNKEYVDKRVADSIEANRKGDCKVRFADAEGKPLAGKKVKISQRSHDFKYGANIFLLDEFPDEGDNEAYRREFKKYFNLATVPFYWCDLEPEEGKPRYAADSPKIYRRPAPDLCVQYCEENGIMPKLHCLVYDYFRPEWTVGRTDEEIIALYEKRFSEIAERYAGKFFELEVINEQFLVKRLKTEILKTPTAVKDMFALARKHFP
ncbi:MAG: glycoside hydrolase family 10, partial [Clostridia bacterium]|nr:glycoside hydrolase family 10 [Clostridia bacterium]